MKKRTKVKIRAKKIKKRFLSTFIILGFGKKIIYKKKNLKNKWILIDKTILIKKSYNNLSNIMGKDILLEKLKNKELFAVYKKISRY